MFYLVKPPVNAFDIAAAHAAIGSVHRDEGILTIHTPDVVAEAFGALVEGAFIVCHQRDPVRADVDLSLMKSWWLGSPSVARHRRAFQGCAGMEAADETIAGRATRFWRLISFRF
jgi:hypothetical protein